MTADPRSIFLAARNAQQAGDHGEARRLLDAGIAQFPGEAGLHHALGKLLLATGDPAESAACFARAVALAPGNTAFAVDQAIALSAAGQFARARALLHSVETASGHSAHYCSARAAAERGAGDLAAAALWYDRALAIEPARTRAMQGRATVALERGEPDALARFDALLAQDASNPQSWYGKAQALDVAGHAAEARQIAEALVEKLPHWPDALKLLAQLKLAAGEDDFAGHYAAAAERLPKDVGIRIDWAQQLSGLDRPADALAVIEQARRDFPDHARLPLLEAIYAGDAGDDETANALFAAMVTDTRDRWLFEGRQAIRTADYDRAEQALERAIAGDAGNVAAWALRGLLWRLTGDTRAEWLHGQEGLIRLVPLHDSASVLPPAIDVLHKLHDGSPFPLGQSLRGGTQTRGRLFDRTEPALAALHRAILATLEAYRDALPPADATHPLLRHRDTGWRISGSWSVRLSGGGDHHKAHIHPQGIVSSALYCCLPRGADKDDAQAGWLELGRPPPEMRCDLEPLAVLQPQEGCLALFPSTLYHGTRMFAQEQRMTTAFDVTSNPTENEARP